MASNATKIRDWTMRFERFRRSNKTVSLFCRDEQVSLQAFYYWRDRVQATSRDDLEESSRAEKSLAVGSKASVTGQQVVAPDLDGVRFVIRIGTISIECHTKSYSAMDAVLSWAARNQESSFKQLIAR